MNALTFIPALALSVAVGYAIIALFETVGAIMRGVGL